MVKYFEKRSKRGVKTDRNHSFILYSSILVLALTYITVLLLGQQNPFTEPQRLHPSPGSKVADVLSRILNDKFENLEARAALVLGESLEAAGEKCETKGIDCVIGLLEDAEEFFRRKEKRKYSDEELVLQLSEMLKEVEKGRKIPEVWSEKELKRLNIHEPTETLYAWQIYQNNISKQGLYLSKEIPLVDNLLNDLVHLNIVGIEEIPEEGTQIKFILLLEDGSKALFKPMRVPRDNYETLDVYYMYEKERHTAEIAAFHLNKILGFNNVPPTAGRIVDIEDDLYEHVSDDLKDQFFYSPVDNLCFYADCEYFCTAAHAVCGVGTKLEGSMAAFNPEEGPDENLENFWQRSYSKYNKSEWELAENGEAYCENVKKHPPYDHAKTLLNVIDTVIFDFLIGNKDRHHFYTFERYSNNSAMVLFDNGKGFGRAYDDINDILAPLYQCCQIRFTTLRTLLALHTSPSPLSARMRSSLEADVLKNILTEAHLRALDRRVAIVLEKVLNCLRERPGRDIVIDDGYYYERG